MIELSAAPGSIWQRLEMFARVDTIKTRCRCNWITYKSLTCLQIVRSVESDNGLLIPSPTVRGSLC